MVSPRWVRMVPRLSELSVGIPLTNLIPVPETAVATGRLLNCAAKAVDNTAGLKPVLVPVLFVVALKLWVVGNPVASSQAIFVLLAGLKPGHGGGVALCPSANAPSVN